jgi:fructoselysine-6-P-deglycase FrlB-like protein
MVNERTLVIGLLRDGNAEEETILTEMRQLGATTLHLTESANSDFEPMVAGDDAAPALVSYMPPLQWMAYYRAIKKSLDPDKPNNLDMVVFLK